MLESKYPKTQTSLLNQFITVAIQFHQRVASVFLPTAVKFHYLFNLRDLSNIVQVIRMTIVSEHSDGI
jgi:dynein heavy chain, axonemal